MGQPGAGPIEDGQQNNQPFQFGQGNVGNNQVQAFQVNQLENNAQAFQVEQGNDADLAFDANQEEYEAEEVNPNAQWDFLAVQNGQNAPWDQWPAPQNPQQAPVQNPVNMEIDLNANLPNMDMQEVIINPVNIPDAVNEGFLELNDLIQEADEEVIQLAAQNPSIDLNDPPAEPVLQQQLEKAEIPHVDLPIEPVIHDEEDEIPYHMLLDENVPNSEEDNSENYDSEEHPLDIAGNHVLHVGAVLLRNETMADPVLFRASNSPMDSVSKAWLAALDKLPGKSAKVAAHWAPFFTSMLLSPASYKWAKSFIESEAWTFFNKSLKTASIRIPDKGPLINPCSSSEGNPLLSLNDVVTKNQQPAGILPEKRSKKSTPLVESEVRRSPRLNDANKGFKPDGCPNKKCLACNPNPPELSHSLIKNLGLTLCQIDDDLLSEKAL